LSSPIASEVPVHGDLRQLQSPPACLVCIDDLLVRRHLPQAIHSVRDRLP
jgi:hypothetical protein